MSAMGQKQTSNPFGIRVRSALNTGSQLPAVDTSAPGHEQTFATALSTAR